MDSDHPLKTLLQLQLASDALAVLHLPYILSSLSPEALQPSAHTQKWTTRINSLIHAKEPGARWAGLCIAQQTSTHSKALMLECAQSWVTVVLPLLSKNENVPVLKAAIRLLQTIFTKAVGIPEFQRQVSTPNVPKFSASLLALIEKRENEDIVLLAMETLTHLVPLYPTLHRTLHTSLSSVTLRFLNGSTPKPTPFLLLRSASRLYAVLHHTGGKVGAANQWRRSLDDTLSFAWGAFLNLRTTFKSQGYDQSVPQASTSNEDPVMSVPLYVDRLKAAMVVLEDLLHAYNPRPVLLPIGSIVRLCQALLTCTRDDKSEGHVDPLVHSMELSILPRIWTCGCELTEGLVQSARGHLGPHLSRICLYLVRLVEQTNDTCLRLSLLQASRAVLSECSLHDAVLASRLMRGVLPNLTYLLATQSDVQRDEDSIAVNAGKGRKGKKRARGYEGDEVFKLTKEVIFSTKESGDVFFLSLEIIRLLMLQSPLSPSLQSITSRVLLAVYMSMPSIPPSLFSLEPAMHARIYEKVQSICTELGVGTTSTLSKSLGLIIGASLHGPNSLDIMRELDLQLHPRVPPLVRSLPHVESLALFRVEESQEESEMRHALRIATIDELHQPPPAQGKLTVPPTPITTVQSGATEVLVAEPPSIQATQPASVYLASPTSAPAASGVQAMPSSAWAPTSAGFRTVPAKSTEHAPQSIPHETTPSVPAAAPPKPNPLSLAERPATTVAITAPSLSAAPITQTTAIVVDEEGEDEPMPIIDMGSDSDSD